MMLKQSKKYKEGNKMRKLITILFVLFAFTALFTLTATSQVKNGIVAFVADTTTDSETEYSVVAAANINAIKVNYLVTITVVPVHVSGTAVVNAAPQGSLDNVTYYSLAAADTVATGGVATATEFRIANAYWRYYRVVYVSTGSGVNTLNGHLGIKKQ